MALPADLQTVNLTGTYIGFDGVPLSGTVRFEPSVPLVDPANDVVIMPQPFVVALDSNGHFSTQLPATNDPDLNPIGFTYKVTESFGRAGSRTYNIQIPYDAIGPVDISDLVPLAASDPGQGVITHDSLAGVTANQHHAQDHGDSNHITPSRVLVQDEGSNVSERKTLNFIGGGVVVAENVGSDRVDITISGAAPPGLATVQDEGTPLTQQTTINFIGAGVTAANDGGNSRTNVTIPGGGTNYQTVQDEGVDQTVQPKLNFIGAGVTVTNDGPGGRTNVTIPSTAATTMPRPSLCVVYSLDYPAALKTNNATYDFQCDAVNDQTEINNAITQAAITRGDVMLMGFQFKIRAPILMKTATHLKGLGRGVTKVEVDTTGWAGDAAIKFNDVNVHATELRDFWVDGKNIAGVTGIKLDNTGGLFTGSPSTSPDPRHSVHDISIDSCALKGLWLVANTRGSSFGTIYVLNAGEEGLRNESPDCDFYNIQSGSAGGVGIYLGGSNCRYTNMKSWFSDSHGFQISAAARQTLTNCESQDNLGSGFHITTGQQTLTGCQADSNSYDGSPSSAITGRSFYGFNFVSCTGLLAQACLAYDKNESGRGARQLYGFFFNSAAGNNFVDGVTKGNFTGSVGGTIAATTTTRIKSADGF